MVTANINGRTINIVWNYALQTDPETRRLLSVETRCTIRDDSERGNPQYITSAISRKSDRDVHCKEIARKISLSRALQTAGFNQEERATIWNAYLNRPRPKNAEQAKLENEKLEFITPEEAQEQLDSIFADTMINTMSVV